MLMHTFCQNDISNKLVFKKIPLICAAQIFIDPILLGKGIKEVYTETPSSRTIIYFFQLRRGNKGRNFVSVTCLHVTQSALYYFYGSENLYLFVSSLSS